MRSSTASHSDLLQLGWVGRAHGLHGEVEVKLAWPDSNALEDAKHVVLQAEGQEPRRFNRLSVRKTPKGFLVRLEGVSDRPSAEALRSAAISIARADLEPLAPGEYYLGDVVGLDVSSGGRRLGVVAETISYPSVDVAVVRTVEGGVAHLLLLEDGSVRVDVEAGSIEMADGTALLDPVSGEPLP